MNREDKPWCHVPPETTADEILERLWNATIARCTCGGSGPGEENECAACRTWHFVTGNTDEGEK